MRNISLSYLLLMASISAGMAFGQPKNDWVPGQLLVQSRLGAHPSEVARTLRTHGASVQREISQIKVHVLRVPEPAIDRVRQSLERTGLFTFVERDFLARVGSIPNDLNFVSEWHLTKIQAPAAWDITPGSSSVTIAIADTGVDPNHEDLQPKLVTGWNFLNGSTNTADGHGHGSATAGSAAAATNNTVGVAGVGWANPIMPLLIADSSGNTSYSNMANAITYAADHGVRIVSMSLAGPSASSTLQSAINYAWNKGTVLFASAGNYNTSTPYYPAAADNAVAVSATDPSDNRSSYSNFGNWIDVAAPGDSILTTNNGGGYGYHSGTSFAAPVAAGVGALVLSAKPSLSASALVSILQQNADDLGSPGFDQYFGSGRVNAFRAVSAALATGGDSIRPTVTISNPLPGATVSGTIPVQGTAVDNVGVTRTEFYVDNQLVSSGNASFSFSWNTAGVANGTHTLTVKAYDAASNVGESSVSVNVNNVVVADSIPPTVAITTPSNGSFLGNKNVKVTVSANDNRGVTQVCIFIDGTLKTTLTTAPYSYTLSGRKLAAGAHVITSKAWDAAGNMGAAAPITVNKQ
jgi:subtilase family protein/Big-like domain-containing protein/fervidolysin-like protein